MHVKNNYKECITNLACSIRKYFELDYKHNSLEYIDKLLEEYKPENVITILCDGMGSNILDRTLDNNSYLIQNRMKVITTVFPATTVAATTSMITGLNPVETAMLGWDMYYKDIDKTITTFFSTEKGDKTEKVLPEAVEYKKSQNMEMLLNSVVQGSTFLDLRRECARELSKMDADLYPIGAVVPLMESYHYKDLVDVVMNSMKELPDDYNAVIPANFKMIVEDYAKDTRRQLGDGTKV